MKNGNTYYLQLSRSIFNDDKYKDLSNGAKWLFVVLNELEQRYCGTKTSNARFFVRSDDQLAADAGISESKLKRDKAELLNTDLIKSWQAHYIVDQKSRKLSERHITAYEILR